VWCGVSGVCVCVCVCARARVHVVCEWCGTSSASVHARLCVLCDTAEKVF
jgi:hypothetical protein